MPSFALHKKGEPTGVAFAGIPMGHEFTSLVLALLQVGGHPPKASDELIEQIRALDADLHFETYFSLSCQNCPEVVQALNLMAILNPRISHDAIDGALFQGEVEAREVMSVPSIFLNGEPFDQGRMSLEQILARVDTGAAEREAARLGEQAAFDTLMIGGGPAGAAAAVYAARKGIRTGVAAERFGGQVLDTLAIENLISVPRTEGPRLAAALEEHVREYEVDIMNLQRAVELVPGEPGGEHEVRFASGASLRSRTLVLATGERRRVDLEGVFVQIGQVPNTEWLVDSPIELSDRGEIVIDARGMTSVPGIFAAGDVTTVPYKQIAIAMGEGSKAALGAFDHLIRS
nr:FAD-dependent oxidoreductase [Halomonas sp. M4R1S46]